MLYLKAYHIFYTIFRCVSSYSDVKRDQRSPHATLTSSQVQELRVFIKSKGADIAETGGKEIVQNLTDVIEQSQVCWCSGINDNDLESIFNSIISLVYVMPLPQSTAIVESFCERILAVTNDKRNMMRLKLLVVSRSY